ncbi:flavin reductase family protein [Fusobacterium sp. PH5-44]|uniref:flavin reductase family protein n=1 Tax=unclassified Fusobacterium TaxID=2648384 RepID=UPI003D19183E
MSDFKEINIKDFKCNPFEIIGNDWMLITAEKDGKVNTMTASWGGLGVIWGHNVASIYVRQSRFTKEFIESADKFSLSFFEPEKYKKALTHLGTVSGRKENKIETVGFTIASNDIAPYFEEAKRVMICKKLSSHLLAPEGFINKEIDGKWYSDKDYHTMYIGEILKILEK